MPTIRARPRPEQAIGGRRGVRSSRCATADVHACTIRSSVARRPSPQARPVSTPDARHGPPEQIASRRHSSVHQPASTAATSRPLRRRVQIDPRARLGHDPAGPSNASSSRPRRHPVRSPRVPPARSDPVGVHAATCGAGRLRAGVSRRPVAVRRSPAAAARSAAVEHVREQSRRVGRPSGRPAGASAGTAAPAGRSGARSPPAVARRACPADVPAPLRRRRPRSGDRAGGPAAARPRSRRPDRTNHPLSEAVTVQGRLQWERPLGCLSADLGQRSTSGSGDLRSRSRPAARPARLAGAEAAP